MRPTSQHRTVVPLVLVPCAVVVLLAAAGGADAGVAQALEPPDGEEGVAPNVSLAGVTAPEAVVAGSDYRIVVELANDGATSAEARLGYAANGRERVNRTVSVPPGGRTVTLNRTAPAEGGTRIDHRVTVAGETWTGTTAVRGRDRARFVVADVRKSGGPPQAAAGERVEVVGRVVNEGNATGTQAVRVVADGTVVGNETLTLAPGESVEVSAEAVATADGRYGSLDVRVVTANDSMGASIPVETTPTETPTDTPTGTPTDAPGDDPTPTDTPTRTTARAPTTGGGSGSSGGPDGPTGTDRTTTGGGSPGPGVTAALAALLVAALVFRYRRTG